MAEPDEKHPGTVAEQPPDTLTDEEAGKVSGGALGVIELNRVIATRQTGLDEGRPSDGPKPPVGHHGC
jgi:hypothetical protein